MMDSINFNLANVSKGAPSRAPKPAPAAPAPYGPKLEKDTWKGNDDYARRHREAFAVKEPPKGDSGAPKLGLSWKLDEMTTVKLKPSLKKFKIELTHKF